jgi:hypothetical protein
MTFKIVRISDPAILSREEADYGRYCITRDFKLLAFEPGLSAEIFHARDLTPQERREVANKATDRDQWEAAFVRGLVKVENLWQGEEQRDWTKPDDASGREKMLSDKILEALFDEATIQEIGSVIRNRSFLGRTKGVFFPLPAISLSAQAARGNALRAELMRVSSASAQSSSGAKEEPITPSTETKSERSGDASTDATATASATP